MRYFLLPFLLVTIGSADIEQAILKYLAAHYAMPDAQYVCDLSGISVQTPESDSVAVDGFGKENPRGRTTARLSFYHRGQRVQSSVVSVRIGVLKPVLVASSAISAGVMITPEMTKFETRDISDFNDEPLSDPGRLDGVVSARFIPAGRVLTSSALKVPSTIKKGDPVRIVMRKGPLYLALSGIARDDGFTGEKIRVMNTDSRKVLTGVIIDPQTVEIGEMEMTLR